MEDHWNGELAVSYDALKTVSEGKVADMGIVVPEYTAEQLPLHQIFKSFPLGPDNGDAQVKFFHNVFRDMPQFSAELAANNLVNLQFFLGYPAAFFLHPPLAEIRQSERYHLAHRKLLASGVSGKCGGEGRQDAMECANHGRIA